MVEDHTVARPGRRRVGVALVLLVLLVAGWWTVQVVRVVRSVEIHATYWSQPRGEPGGLVYVALGDSAAQGIGAHGPEAGYVGLIAERLRNATGLPVRVVNLSVSGARVGDVVNDQLPALDGQCADLITIGVGGNDIREYDASTFADDVTALTAALPADAVIADLPYFMHGQWEADARQGNVALRQAAGAAGLTVAPLYDTIRDQGWAAMFTDYAADWFHPDDDGHAVWAQAFWTAVEPMIPDESRCS